MVVLAVFVESSKHQLLDLVFVLQCLLSSEVFFCLINLLLQSISFEVVAVAQYDGLHQLLELPPHEHGSKLISLG